MEEVSTYLLNNPCFLFLLKYCQRPLPPTCSIVREDGGGHWAWQVGREARRVLPPLQRVLAVPRTHTLPASITDNVPGEALGEGRRVKSKVGLRKREGGATGMTSNELQRLESSQRGSGSFPSWSMGLEWG